MSKWLLTLLSILGAVYLAILYLWWIYFLNQGIYLITLFDNPHQSHTPGYIIVAGFFSYPIFVLVGLISLWMRRNTTRLLPSALLMILPLASILAFFGGSQFIQYREDVRFEANRKSAEMSAQDFLCPNGKYIQVDAAGTVSLVTNTDDVLQETWEGNIDSQTNTFEPAGVATNWWEDELKDCKNQAGEIFLRKYQIGNLSE